MSTINTDQLAEQVLGLYGIHFDKLMTPISETQPSGPYLKYEDVYFNIQQARTSDDSSLPMGVWDHDLKKAEWNRVIELCASTLNQKSKDIQLGVWLLEAGIHRFGFAGLAPALFVIYSLCEKFWDDVHPQIEHDDLEYRINPIVWANDKLLPSLRLVPIIPAAEDGKSYCWSDWLQACKQSELSKKRESNKPVKEALLSDFKRIESDLLQERVNHLKHALIMSERLVALLDSHCMEYAPSLGHIQNLLTEVCAFTEDELRCRGHLEIDGTAEDIAVEIVGAEKAAEENGDFSITTSSDSHGAINGRKQTYRDVEKAAQTLLKIDPHSPAPYLILQACRWGTMDTRELYKELFVECGGQLNIFELLGVDSSAMPVQSAQ